MAQWRKIIVKGYPFEVSDAGGVRIPARPHKYTRIRNGKEQTIERIRKAQEYTPQQTKGGYMNIELTINGERIRVGIHRLVALAFCEGHADGLCVNHINGNKSDNRAENLEWVSLARNTEHAWETGLVDVRGDNQPTAKLTSKRVAYIRKLLNQGINPHTLAIVAGVSDGLIYLIRDGKRWSGVEPVI